MQEGNKKCIEPSVGNPHVAIKFPVWFYCKCICIPTTYWVA